MKKGERKGVGTGWYEAGQPVLTERGMEIKAPRHSEVQQRRRLKSTLRTPADSFTNYLSSMIQKAIAEDSRRLSHGYTKYNAFWIDGAKIIPYNEHKKVLASKNVISVHSHSPENWRDFTPETSSLDPLNSRDMVGLQHMVKYGYGNTLALISAYGELEYIRFTPDSDRRFLTLSHKKLYKIDEIPYEAKAEYYEKYKKPQSYLYREVMKSFCDYYRLEYRTGLRWKGA